MKSKFSKIPIFIFSLLIFTISCDRSENEPDYDNDIDLRGDILEKINTSVIANLNINDAISEREIDIWNTDASEMVFFSDSGNLTILQSDNKLSKLPNLESGKYQMLELPGIVILKGLENNILSLISVENESTVKILKEIYALNIKFNNKIEGFGLINHFNAEDNLKIPVDDLKKSKAVVYSIAQAYHADEEHFSKQHTSCPEGSSGGEGSNSCSNANCSVSCSGAYYACCEATCYCVSPYIQPSDDN